jgi:tetratricopeptide (TPR) repeat protein
LKKWLSLIWCVYSLLFFSCVSAGKNGITEFADVLSLDEVIEQSAVEIATKLTPGVRIAIVAFEAESDNLAGYVMDELTGSFVNSRLEVADRNNLEYVFKELNLQMSGIVDDDSAAGVGKFLGAAYVITGQLLDLGSGYRYRINAINTETAIHEGSVRMNVRNDPAFKNLLVAIQRNVQVIRAAKYAITENTQPTTAGTYLDRGILFASRGDYDTAIEDFTQAIKLNPQLKAAYINRAKALRFSVSTVINVGENFSGGSTIHTSIFAPGVPTRTISNTEEQRIIYDRAIADYTQAIRLDPDYAVVYNDRGIAYYSKGDYDHAIEDYTQAIHLNQNLADAYDGRGSVYNIKGDHDRAIADYTQAIRLNPNSAGAYMNRGTAYHEKGNYDHAISDYNQAIRLDPNMAVAYSNRGIAYIDKSDYDRAIVDCTKAIQLDPNDPSAYHNRGTAYDSKGDYDRAIADYNQAIRLAPNNPSAYVNRGISYDSKGDYNRAISDHTQAIKLDPNLAAAYGNRATVYHQKEDYEHALADYTQAIRLAPKFLEAFFNRGILYYGKGDFQKAVLDFTQVLQLDPDNINAKQYLENARRQVR